MGAVFFDSRPGGSPALAALLVRGVLHKKSRVLDVCCGLGPDSFLLAQAGVEDVLGVDEDRDQIAEANERAEALDLACRFRRLDLPTDFFTKKLRANYYDAVIDTLGAENVIRGPKDQYSATRARKFVTGIARVLKDGGLWIHHARHFHPRRLRGAGTIFPKGSAEYFKLGSAYPTHLAEYRPEDHGDEDREGGLVPAIASVYFAIAVRRARR